MFLKSMVVWLAKKTGQMGSDVLLSANPVTQN